MRVALVATKSWPMVGGMQQYVYQVAQHLSRRDDTTLRVVTRFAGENPGREDDLLLRGEPARTIREASFPIHVLGYTWMERGSIRLLGRLAERRRMKRWIKRLAVARFGHALSRYLRDVDVVHFSGRPSEHMFQATAYAAESLGLPLVVTPHIHEGKIGDSAEDIASYGRADHILAITKHERKLLTSRGVPEDKVSVVSHGVSVAGTGDKNNLHGHVNVDRPVVLFLGRNASDKGFHLTIDAMPAVWSAHPETQFVFAGGDGSGPSLSAEERELLEDARVWHAGVVTDARKEDLLDACDLVCLPSVSEAFGLVYLEGWYYRAAAVGCAIPPVQELFQQSGGGVTVAHTTDAVAEAVIDLLSNDAKRGQMARRGRTFAERSTWAEATEHIREVYGTVASCSVCPSRSGGVVASSF